MSMTKEFTVATSPFDIGGRAFPFLKVNPRPPKPRTRGITVIRGPYYTPMGRHFRRRFQHG